MLTIRTDGPVAYVTLNRPDVRNAFNAELVEALGRWAREAAGGGGIRAAVLAGAGPAFCAGADVAWMSQLIGASEQENLEDARRLAGMYEALDTLPFPLIGRIHGAALGGGSGLAAVCDIAVAAQDAVFGFTEVRLGILPAVIAPYVLAKIGPAAARQLFLTGSRFPAERAQAIGLVHAVVPAAGLDAAVHEQVAEVLRAAPGAVAKAKALVARLATLSRADATAVTTEAIARQRVSSEGQEGMRAFLERRKAGWHRP